MPDNQSKVNNRDAFLFLLILTGFFILFEISFFIQCNKHYLSEVGVVAANISIPSTILPEIAYFLVIQIGLHFLYALIIWYSALYYCYLFNFNSGFFPVWLWFAGIIAIITGNQIIFPNSKYSGLSSVFIPMAAAKVVSVGLALFCLFIFACAVFGFLLYCIRNSFNFLLFLLLIIAAGTYKWQHHYATPGTIANNNSDLPNVIIVGIDSLRPDILGYFGGNSDTPFLDTFLGKSAVFTSAVTPIARTFPSWVSILTGKYPKENGVRSNLTSINDGELQQALPAIFKAHGYRTVYATDETRFSNIDNQFGFQSIISPPMGLNDFLLGSFNDFPLSNLLVNTIIGKYLFPYSYANRPAVVTYQPDTFLGEIKRSLLLPHSQPLFMSIHFCLPHYPYIWSDLSVKNLSIRERYLATIERVDRQVAGFFKILDQAGLLNHAIIVLLSDHGEALELPGDRITERNAYVGELTAKNVIPKFYPPTVDDEDINQSAGHGTDVLSLPQYHTLLAIRLIGLDRQKNMDIPGIVSLIDIKPTLLELTGLGNPESNSLVSAMNGHPVLSRHIFMESDYSPESIRSIHPDIRKTMLQGANLFVVDPDTTRLHLKPEMLKKIIESKQYADLYGEWVLALYPRTGNGYHTILVNLQSGKWTNDLNSDFAAKSPAKSMLNHIKIYASH